MTISKNALKLSSKILSSLTERSKWGLFWGKKKCSFPGFSPVLVPEPEDLEQLAGGLRQRAGWGLTCVCGSASAPLRPLCPRLAPPQLPLVENVALGAWTRFLCVSQAYRRSAAVQRCCATSKRTKGPCCVWKQNSSQPCAGAMWCGWVRCCAHRLWSTEAHTLWWGTWEHGAMFCCRFHPRKGVTVCWRCHQSEAPLLYLTQACHGVLWGCRGSQGLTLTWVAV